MTVAILRTQLLMVFVAPVIERRRRSFKHVHHRFVKVRALNGSLLADLLTLHELQMRSAPFHVVEKANRRMLESARALPADRADIHHAA
ncbi:hypothetical protein [Paraburkholderia kirstenboschensis]|uniref:Secreted protein n=1 Tax=Paraburkholderia kirstenboschensis TaxID=1245436 RepID=A0ABZ0EU00_9BURK|nr:hypothetical protein [Paraburkholderia kirstenboschensis]WOD20606.1 hypothetical protein RW095_31035 [Paraburkholderia kirstenboschensis]